MSFILKGKLVDVNNNNQPLSAYTIKAFDKEPIIDVFGDEPLGSSVTLDDGTFSIYFTKDSFKKPLEFWESGKEPNIYLKVYDPDGRLFKETPVLSTPFVPYKNPDEINQCETVVVGSGFGGTITSLSLVNKYVKDDWGKPDSQKKKVVVLERGQWWVSHELPSSPGGNEPKKKPNLPPIQSMREYLETNDIPYRTWLYPDNINGLTQFLNTIRVVDRRGLYDFRISNKVHTIAGSGVGGGSLVYTNVTEEPDENVINSWDTELSLGINNTNLTKYFDMASGFIGVNKIATTTALGTSKLPKTKAFQDAAKQILAENTGIVRNKPTFDALDLDQKDFVEDIFAANLSITDIPQRKDQNTLFTQPPPVPPVSVPPAPPPPSLYSTVLNSIQSDSMMQEKLAILQRKYFGEPNVCERQGRCALGCIPGARHTNNKKIFDYLKNQYKSKHFVLRPLCEVYDIEPLLGGGAGAYNYKVYYNDYSARDWKQASFNLNANSKSFILDVKLFRYVDNGAKKTIECKTLVLAAGSIGSTEILLKAVNTTRTTGQKLNLSNKLGQGYSSNGDLLGVINPSKTDIYATRGPIVTSAIKFNEGPGLIYTIEDSSVPKMFSGVSRLLSQGPLLRRLLGFAGTGLVQQVINMMGQNPIPIPIPIPGLNLPVQISEQDLTNVMLLSGMGTDSSDGIIKLQDAWKNNPNRDMNALNVLDINFNLNKLEPLFNKMRHFMERIAKHIGEGGAASFSTPLWNPNDRNDRSTIVLHNLGGCSMGKDRNHGVVDNFGRVYKGNGATSNDYYSELYVVDGGIVPTSLGINSSLTISALAFRIAENIVGSEDYLPVEKGPTISGKDIYFPK
jgi:choline dehydrogenase-like flavoprotein